MYKKVSGGKLQTIQKKTKQIGQKKAATAEKNGKKPSGYQIFNQAIKERKLKDKSFSVSVEEKKETWARISSKISDGKLKATKKDIFAIVKSW